MANTELKIDDEAVKTAANTLAERASDLQKGVDNYIKTLNAILDDAIMEGDTADALRTFVGYADSLKSVINTMGTEAKGLCVNFIQEVDSADEYLY